MASLEEEAKRVIPAIKNRQALMQRQWDGVPATAAAFGLKGQDKLFTAVVKAVEKGCRGPGTLQALRRLKVDYKESDGEGNEVAKTAMMSVMTHSDPGYEGFWCEREKQLRATSLQDVCASTPCGQHGTCVDRRGAGGSDTEYSCKCEWGWSGENCDDPTPRGRGSQHIEL